ncbi:MAG: 2-phospho-L-lactate transferase [Dehalococcoidia bacterium]|nr:2-phospho-L-lactate transferase [Dehalococcoidia bacterium]
MTGVKITVLAGGIGAARFLAGLQRVVDPTSITAICNVSDDLTWHGLHVSPDIDSVLYTLAGEEGEHGWGVRGDTTVVLDELRALGGDAWFTIGDRDLATHLLRTARLLNGGTLTESTAALARARGVGVTVLPVTDDPHPTIIRTAEGDLSFQDYFVRRRAQGDVLGFDFPGADAARPAPGVLRAIGEADLVVIAPSNPFVSIGPLLLVPGVRQTLADAHARRVAVSPIVGGAAVKGPAADMLRSLGHEVSALAVASLYRGLVDLFVLDAVDEALLSEVRALGMDALAVDTMMTGDEGRERVARNVLAAAGFDADGLPA